MTAYKTNFVELEMITKNVDQICTNEILMYCIDYDIRVKSFRYTENAFVLYEATEFLETPAKSFYHTLFSNILPLELCFGDFEGLLINEIKYSNLKKDDLGWLNVQEDLYYMSFNTKTLITIVNDFQLVDFNLLKELYFQSREKRDFIHEHTLKLFDDFIYVTNLIIDIYKSSILENKDIIIMYD